MAFGKEFKSKNSTVVRSTATISTIDNFQATGTNVVTTLPTLNLSFNSPAIDPRISFTRASGATYVGVDGFIEYAGLNVPRVEYSSTSTGTCIGLLIEEQRTNLLPSSSQFAGWNNNTNLPIYDNSMISPDGNMTAAITYSSGSTRFKGTSSVATSGTYYTYSIYFKPTDTTKSFRCYVDGNINSGNAFGAAFVDVVPSTNAVTLNGLASTGTVVIAGNGWYRMSVTFIPLSASQMNCHVYPINADLTGWWGAQTEQGIFATSYIPTTTSQVTRAADRCLLKPGPWYSPNIGTWYASFQGGRESTQGFYGRVLSPSGSATILSTDNGITSVVGSWAGGLNIVVSTAQDFWTTPGGAALAYNNSTLTRSLSARGLISTGNYTVSDAPSYIISTAMGIGQNAGGATNMLNGHITRIMYWPAVLTNTQLQVLTTASTFADTNFASKSTIRTHVANTSDFTVKQGLIVGNNFEVPDIDKFYITTLTKPSQQPSLNLNFLRGTIDNRITFTRASGATVVGPSGYIQYVGNNVPRIDYSSTSTGTCLGLLIEDQRTNFLLYSSSIGSSPSWNTRSGTVSTLNSGISPDGNRTATLVSQSSGDGYVWESFSSYTPSTTYTISVYASAVSGTPTIRFNIWNNVNNYLSSIFTLSSALTRYTYTFTTGATVGVGDLGFYIVGGSALVWGAQFEAGTFATSYIPTGSSQVTRSTDLATMNGQNFQSWYRTDQGTILVEADSLTASADDANKYRWPFAISNGSSQRIGVFKAYSNSQLYPKLTTDSGIGAIFSPLLGNISTSTTFKVALSYKTGSQYSALNYNSTSADSVTATMPSVVDTLRIGNGDAPWCGHIRRIVFYPEQLANTVTQSLTVI